MSAGFWSLWWGDLLTSRFSVTPGEGYLEALQEENVEIVRTSIKEITSNSVVTSEGKAYPVDVIIAATGYDTSYTPAFKMTGRHGVDLGARWAKTGAEAYFTCAVPDMPNYFSKFPSITRHFYAELINRSGGWPQHSHLQRLPYALDRGAGRLCAQLCQQDPMRGSEVRCRQQPGNNRVQRLQGRSNGHPDLFRRLQ